MKNIHYYKSWIDDNFPLPARCQPLKTTWRHIHTNDRGEKIAWLSFIKYWTDTTQTTMKSLIFTWSIEWRISKRRSFHWLTDWLTVNLALGIISCRCHILMAYPADWHLHPWRPQQTQIFAFNCIKELKLVTSVHGRIEYTFIFCKICS